jgi:uncharacterized protein (UPF0261 family)
VLLALGTTPVAAAASYELPFPVVDLAAARRLGLHIEEGVASTWYATLSAVTRVSDRQLAVAALADAAARALQWRLTVPGEPSTVPFPGR